MGSCARCGNAMGCTSRLAGAMPCLLPLQGPGTAVTQHAYARVEPKPPYERRKPLTPITNFKRNDTCQVSRSQHPSPLLAAHAYHEALEADLQHIGRYLHLLAQVRRHFGLAPAPPNSKNSVVRS